MYGSFPVILVSEKKSKGKNQPTIPSYHKGDIAVAGFGLRY